METNKNETNVTRRVRDELAEIELAGFLPPSDKIKALLKREAAIKAAIAAEKVKRQTREAANRKRLALIVGEALLDYAEKSPDFKLMLKQVLGAAALDDASRRFLAGRGWV